MTTYDLEASRARMAVHDVVMPYKSCIKGTIANPLPMGPVRPGFVPSASDLGVPLYRVSASGDLVKVEPA